MAAANHIEVVVVLEDGVELGYQGGSRAGDGHDAEIGIGLKLLDGAGELGHVHVQKGRVLLQLEYRQLQFSAGEVQGIVGGRVAQELQDFVAGALLRVEYQVQPHVLEQEFVFRE